MDVNFINFFIGYFIVINIVGIVLIWIKQNTDFIKTPNKVLNIVFLVLSLVGGFIGVLVGAEMFHYEQENKLFKRWIPFFIFIEVCIIIYIVYQNFK